MTVVVEGGRITALAPSARIRPRPGTRTVDLTGKYLMPGLIEAHTHSDGPETVVPALYALTGVTTVREMRGEPVHHEWRRKIRSGELLGPRWVIGSPIVDGTPSLWAADVGPTVEVADAAEARRAVRRVKREGADFVKVYSRLSRESYFAIADEAAPGSPHLGHCPDTVRIAEASAAGHRTIEHLHALLLATSRHEKEIRRLLDAVRIDPSDPSDPSSLSRYHSWFQQVHPLEWRAVQGYDRGLSDALFRSLATHGTTVVPTLSVHRTLELPDDVPTRAEEWKYLPAWQVESWPDQLAALTGGRTPEQKRQIREIYAHRLRLVRELHGMGCGSRRAPTPARDTSSPASPSTTNWRCSCRPASPRPRSCTRPRRTRPAPSACPTSARWPVARPPICSSSTPTRCGTSATPAASMAWSSTAGGFRRRSAVTCSRWWRSPPRRPRRPRRGRP